LKTKKKPGKNSSQTPQFYTTSDSPDQCRFPDFWLRVGVKTMRVSVQWMFCTRIV